MLHHHIHVTPANAGTILGATTGATISQQQQRQLKQAPAHTKTYTWTMRHTYALMDCVVVHSNCLPPQPLCAQVSIRQPPAAVLLQDNHPPQDTYANHTTYCLNLDCVVLLSRPNRLTPRSGAHVGDPALGLKQAHATHSLVNHVSDTSASAAEQHVSSLPGVQWADCAQAFVAGQDLRPQVQLCSSGSSSGICTRRHPLLCSTSGLGMDQAVAGATTHMHTYSWARTNAYMHTTDLGGSTKQQALSQNAPSPPFLHMHAVGQPAWLTGEVSSAGWPHWPLAPNQGHAL